MPSRIDEAGHTKAFDYPVAEHWGKSQNVQFRRWDSNRLQIGPESNVLPTEPPQFPQRPPLHGGNIEPEYTEEIFRCNSRFYDHTGQWKKHFNQREKSFTVIELTS